jgi:hypothetical protein
MTGEIQALASDPEIADLLKPNYLRHHQREEHRGEIEAIERQIADPVERKKLHNPGRLAQDVKRRRQVLESQSPPPLTASQRDKIARLEKLVVADGREGMVSSEELRSRPPGVVDSHMAWQNGKKRSVLLFQRCRILLNPDSNAPDLCNFERFRPARPGSRELYTDSAIPRVWTLSEEAKANYEAIDWTSPEVAAKIQELVDQGKIRINTGVRRGALRQRRHTGPSFECNLGACSGRPFHGPMAKSNFERHQASAHKDVVEVSA